MIFTDDMKDFLVEYVPGHHHKEIQEAFNDRFDTQITLRQVSNAIKRYKLNTGFTGCFEKGQEAFNKGKKQSEYMKHDAIERTKTTRFKKGQTPKNHKPVGSTRINKDGYLEIKVAEPSKWKLKSRVVWESVHGEIPKNYVVLHKNGNSLDDDIDNLVLMSRSELLRLNQQKLFNKNVEINESAIALAKLSDVIYKAKKKR